MYYLRRTTCTRTNVVTFVQIYPGQETGLEESYKLARIHLSRHTNFFFTDYYEKHLRKFPARGSPPLETSESISVFYSFGRLTTVNICIT